LISFPLFMFSRFSVNNLEKRENVQKTINLFRKK
jgi:hypothetical protein